MKKELFANSTLIILLFSTLFFIKIQMDHNAAYASYQRSFNFLINVLLFLCVVAAGFFIYKKYKSGK